MITYIPNLDPNYPLHNPTIKTIQVNFNIIQKNDSSGNFPNNQTTIDRMKTIIGWVNSFYSNYAPSDPISWVTELPGYDSRIRFSIGELGSERIFFYQNTAAWDDISPSTTIEPYIAHYYPERLEQVNVYIFGNPNNYNWAHANMPSYIDFNRNSWTVLFNWGNDRDWSISGTLAHEFGHNLNLEHTYHGGGSYAICNQQHEDFLQDVFLTELPNHSNCPHTCNWSANPFSINGDGITNNLLGGNQNSTYISPMQAGQIHRSLAISSVRKYVKCENSLVPLVIDGEYLWDFNLKLYRDLIISPNAHLTIRCKLVMNHDAKIIVKPGGKLTIDGGIITTDVYEKSPWQGIEVWGDKNAHQFTINGVCAQGQLILNNATIENAISAVELWKPGDYNTTGGIMIATNSVFRNNAKSVHALHYRNFHPFIPEREMDYWGHFNNCTFVVDENYPATEQFYKHVDLDNVKGFKFNACSFVLSPLATNVSDWNMGIGAYSAGFSANAICTSYGQFSCNEYVPCTFTGFTWAINATKTTQTTHTFYVNRAVFDHNIYGIRVLEINNPVVLNSVFNIGRSNSPEQETCSFAAGYGMYLENAHGFAIEENHFTKATGAPADVYVGIYIQGTQSKDEIYKNSFSGLSFANYSSGINHTSLTYEGLAYLCNTNELNYADFFVENQPPSGIQSLQGSLTQVAGNTFSPSGATWHLYNGGNHLVGYYYCATCPNQNPGDNKIFQVTKHAVSLVNNCPSHYGGGSEYEENIVLSGQQKIETEQDFAQALASHNSVKALYDNLHDGGSTEAKISEIATATSANMWNLRAGLLGVSPHLSNEVLKAVSAKTDVFPTSVIFEVLASNPDELKKNDLIEYLEDKQNPLPSYMVDILRQVAEGTTYKTVLQQQLAKHNRDKTRAANDMIRSCLNEEVVDYNFLRNWLNNLGGMDADRQIIGTYIEQGNWASAMTLANMLPQLYGLHDELLDDHNDYLYLLNLQQTLNAQGRWMNELSDTELSQLNLMAAKNGSAGTQARSITEAYYGKNYFTCPCTDGTAAFKNRRAGMNTLSDALGLSITAKPNPAREWVAFDYTLPVNESSAVLVVTDMTGKTVETFAVTGNQGQKVWDIRGLKPGMYFYTLHAGGTTKSGKIMIFD
ncbi:MAG: T9SS type A sorting domain-containing protein [Bacteroidales bacterium]|nr:T9SS type A sorting domain-containing protein [Bacteroidales bacterium]